MSEEATLDDLIADLAERGPSHSAAATPYEIRVDLELNRAGTWRKLADLDRVTDGSDNATALDSRDGRFAGFTLPSSSGFVYRFSG